VIGLLIVLLVPALKCVEGGSRNPLHILAALVAFLVDILIAHTTWALVAGFPRIGEVTISDTLERLASPVNSSHPDYDLFVQLALKINRATGYHHIKSVKP